MNVAGARVGLCYTGTMQLALNHIVMPHRPFAAFAAAACALGITEVEIRNDLPGVALADGTAASVVGAEAARAGVRIAAINALQRFDEWNAARAAEAAALVEAAGACGARALVLCPVNDRADPRTPEQRRTGLHDAVAALAPMLRSAGVQGLIEPLGFAECALRTKGAALQAIDAAGAADVLALLHDTFHHYLSGEAELFPARTGLVHVSGVDDHALTTEAIRDEHRVLVGPGDRLGTLAQVRALLAGGYRGLVSIEPFAPSVHAAEDISGDLRRSLALLREAA